MQYSCKQQAGKVSPWLIGIVSGFALVISVNILMMTLAMRSSVGEIESNPYEKGMAFQETINKRQYLKSQGISIVATLRDSSATTESEILIKVDQNGTPLSNLELRAELRRPADQTFDRECQLSYIANGEYSCSFAQLPQGLYLMTLLVGESGRHDQELVLTR
jgi:nitrogen fixation protein FixH